LRCAPFTVVKMVAGIITGAGERSPNKTGRDLMPNRLKSGFLKDQEQYRYIVRVGSQPAV